MDGIEVGPAKQKAASSSSSESAKTIKLAIAIAGLLIGGALIAWNMGLFGGAAAGTHEVDPTVPAEVADRTGPQIIKQPNVPVTPQPNKPKSNMNFH